jgi:ABC-type glycerol-3-phosphate transport system substrate-binding protein
MALVTGAWRISATEGAKIKYEVTAVPTLDGRGSVKTLAGWGGLYITTFAKTNSKLSAARAFMNYMQSTAGANVYAATVNRPSPHKQVAAVQSATLKGFAQAMGRTATPQLNNLLENNAGGSNYYDVINDMWNRILVKGQNPTTVLNKTANVLKKNFAAGAKQ